MRFGASGAAIVQILSKRETSFAKKNKSPRCNGDWHRGPESVPLLLLTARKYSTEGENTPVHNRVLRVLRFLIFVLPWGRELPSPRLYVGGEGGDPFWIKPFYAASRAPNGRLNG